MRVLRTEGHVVGQATIRPVPSGFVATIVETEALMLFTTTDGGIELGVWDYGTKRWVSEMVVGRDYGPFTYVQVLDGVDNLHRILDEHEKQWRDFKKQLESDSENS